MHEASHLTPNTWISIFLWFEMSSFPFFPVNEFLPDMKTVQLIKEFVSEINEPIYVCVCVSLWECMCLPVVLSLFLSLYLSCEERTLQIFHPVVIPELKFSLFWCEVFYCMCFFFHILSFSTMCFFSSQGTWPNLGQDEFIFAQHLTRWVSCTSFLDWKPRCSSMTFKVVLGRWDVHLCVPPFTHR